jgi:hypothetical protein
VIQLPWRRAVQCIASRDIQLHVGSSNLRFRI